MSNLNKKESLAKVSSLKQGAKKELKTFYERPTEVFRALREIAKDRNSSLYSVLKELGIKPNKLGFESFGIYASYYFDKVVIYKPYTITTEDGKKISAMKPTKNTPNEYINVLCAILQNKRNEERAQEREAKKALTKETKAKQKKDSERAKIVAKLIENGKSKEEAEFTAALLIA